MKNPDSDFKRISMSQCEKDKQLMGKNIYKIYKQAIQRENQNDHKHKETCPFTEIRVIYKQ